MRHVLRVDAIGHDEHGPFVVIDSVFVEFFQDHEERMRVGDKITITPRWEIHGEPAVNRRSPNATEAQ